MRMSRVTLVLVFFGWAATAEAQTNPAPASGANDLDVAQASQAQAPTGDQAQQPVAAVGEAATKPTRGFFSALGHNLADDVKHIPRRNSVYWMAGGVAAAYAVHPID